MTPWLSFLGAFVAGIVRSRAALQLEVAALRHQLALYKEKGLRPRIRPADRLRWYFVSRWWSEWRRALFIVQPRTVLAWQRKRFRDCWRELSRSAKPGRPKIAPERRALIKRMWTANPTWGSLRIVLELKKLGIDVAKSTVERYQPKEPRETGPGWESPTAEWTAQQLIEAFPFDTAPRFLLRDGDAKFGDKVRRKLDVMGIRELVTAPNSPWQNAYVERVIGTVRRELLDNVVLLGERHLRRLLKSYVTYYNEWRTHRSLEGDAPDRRPVRLAERAPVVEFPAVRGLHHYYAPEAA